MSKGGCLGLALVLALSSMTGQARSEETPDQLHAAKTVIRATLLATPEWAFEQRKGESEGRGEIIESGKVRFAAKEGKLLGIIDRTSRCDSEVVLAADGFVVETCFDGSLQFLRFGGMFTARRAQVIYTMRPAP